MGERTLLSEDERWRVMLARFLLALAMLLYLLFVVLILYRMPTAHRSLLLASTLFVLCAFGASGLIRMRKAAIAAIGLASLISVTLLTAFVLAGRLSVITRHGRWHWTTAIAYSVAFMVYETPIAALIVLLPLTHPLTRNTSLPPAAASGDAAAHS